ncbi:MAG TPA: hypothetical protein PLG50_02465 [bacterium]|nr:hypothetical protein [bacterium]HQG44507.1 hypothetical protein [bacterium]HQI48071.1 hypothetical protein [bacterium]HQJ63311.1 hypothetical protein [bacterium]
MAEMVLPSDQLQFQQSLQKNLGGIFSPNRPLFIARAPGRLEVLGHMAQRTGAMVLHYPLGKGVIVALQPRTDHRIVLRNLNFVKERVLTVEYRLDEILDPMRRNDWSSLRANFGAGEKRWLGYLLAALAMTDATLQESRPMPGLSLALQSSLPIGAGLGSSAALVTALLLALRDALNLSLEDRELVAIGGRVEHEVWMRRDAEEDFLTALLAQREQIALLQGRPVAITGSLALPPQLQLLAIDTGVRRVEDSQRRQELETALEIGAQFLKDVLSEGNLLPYGSVNLEQIASEEWQRRLKKRVPYRCSGALFLQSHAAEAGSFIEPDRRYLPRNVLEFFIEEAARVQAFIHILQEGAFSHEEESFRRLGELLIASHAHYSQTCGMVSMQAEWLVNAVSLMGTDSGLYGARAMPQGEATPVVVLARRNATDRLHNLLARYASLFENPARLVEQSSDGAAAAGVIRTTFAL